MALQVADPPKRSRCALKAGARRFSARIPPGNALRGNPRRGNGRRPTRRSFHRCWPSSSISHWASICHCPTGARPSTTFHTGVSETRHDKSRSARRAPAQRLTPSCPVRLGARAQHNGHRPGANTKTETRSMIQHIRSPRATPTTHQRGSRSAAAPDNCQPAFSVASGGQLFTRPTVRSLPWRGASRPADSCERADNT